MNDSPRTTALARLGQRFGRRRFGLAALATALVSLRAPRSPGRWSRAAR